MKSNYSEDAAFMDDLDAISFSSPRQASLVFLNTVCGLVVLFFIWAFFAHVDEITRGGGEVVPSRHSQIVQSLEGVILQELLVKEGDLVKKDQVLMRLKNVVFASEEKGAEAKLYSLTLRKARLEAEAKGTDFVVPDEMKAKSGNIAENEKNLFLSRQEEYQNALNMIENKIEGVSAQIEETKSQIARDGQNISLIQKELAITSKMVAQKAAPQIEEIRLRRELNDADGSLRAAQDKKSGLESDLSAAKKQKEDQEDKFRSQALGELNDVETELAGLQESLKGMGDRVDRAEIRSPVEGVVNNIAIRTVGGVVEPAMKLAEIVPVGDELKVQARVLPSDIAFLKVGQKARVKLTAYDSSRYGYLDGEVSRVGASSVNGQKGDVFFEIEVRTHKSYLGSPEHPLPITSGMVAEVNIITGKKTILEYLMRPFLRLKDRAFTER
jgi:adhesin transport system membrane fusion protein